MPSGSTRRPRRASRATCWPAGPAWRTSRQPPRPIPLPFPCPGGRRPSPPPPPTPVPQPPPTGRSPAETRAGNRPPTRTASTSRRCATSPTTAAGAPRSSAGSRDLDPATAGIADELSKQYYLGYAASGPKDGRWHSIRVEVRNRPPRRARRGYVAAVSYGQPVRTRLGSWQLITGSCRILSTGAAASHRDRPLGSRLARRHDRRRQFPAPRGDDPRPFGAVADQLRGRHARRRRAARAGAGGAWRCSRRGRR